MSDETRWDTAEREGYAVTHPSLIRAATSGDETAASRFYRIYRPLIVKYGASRGFSEDEVEELVQNVMVAFFKKSETFQLDPRHKFRNYIYGITDHLSKDLLRKKYRAAKVFTSAPYDENPEDGAPAVPVNAGAMPGPSREAEEDEWEAYLKKTAAQELKKILKPVAYQVYELLNEGLSYKEIGQALDISTSSVYNHLNAAKEAFTRVLAELNGDGGAA